MSNKTTFTAGDHDYEIAYDLPRVRDIRAEIGVDIVTNEGMQQVIGNPIDFAHYVWHSIRPQAENRDVDEDQFIREITPKLDEVSDCWLRAYASFSDSIGRSAQAELARAMVAADRDDRKEANRLVDRAQADRIAKNQLRKSASKRRKALAKLVGEGDEEDQPTAGQSSPS